MIASRTMARAPQVIIRRDDGALLQTTRLMADRAGIPDSARLSGMVCGHIDLGWHYEASEVRAWYENEGGLRASQERGRGGVEMAAQPTKMRAVLRDLATNGGASLSGLVSAHGAYVYVCIKTLELKGLVVVDPRTKCYTITPQGREYLEARA